MHPANIADRYGAEGLLGPLEGTLPSLSLVWADNAYQGPGLRTWVERHLGATLEIVRPPGTNTRGVWVEAGHEPPNLRHRFRVLPKRWIVERTFAWLGRNRRLAKDYEELPESEEAFIYAAMTALLVRRLAP